MHGGEALVFFTMFAGGFAMIFGIFYLRSRQNLAMIDKGMNPREPARQYRPAPYRTLKWALLLVGSGAGLFIAYMLDQYGLPHQAYTETYNGNTYHHRNEGNPAIYFSMIAIGGGLGLLISYFMEKKWWDKQDDKSTIA